MDVVARVSSTASWALTTANRRLLAQLLLFLLAGGLGFLTLFTRLTLGRATSLRIREVFRQTGVPSASQCSLLQCMEPPECLSKHCKYRILQSRASSAHRRQQPS